METHFIGWATSCLLPVWLVQAETHLRTLDLRGCGLIGGEYISRLRGALPNVEILQAPPLWRVFPTQCHCNEVWYYSGRRAARAREGSLLWNDPQVAQQG
ncbi:hypothetical protein FA95DRAFT_1014225 [Auriscalpium vulgare]|uniref:Uncharacterized protein n=1 Tax=Auriscalpium vulgare TaxID=40419 RepID=A0ACB8R7C5_9AGAM|nr:hypothetical protein FA95DRAFT_1014225 [Auriscalpium vulgare]